MYAGVPLTALFLAYLRAGADIMSRNCDIPFETVKLIRVVMGLRIRAVGENGHAAKSVGLNVMKYKYTALLVLLLLLEEGKNGLKRRWTAFIFIALYTAAIKGT